MRVLDLKLQSVRRDLPSPTKRFTDTDSEVNSEKGPRVDLRGNKRVLWTEIIIITPKCNKLHSVSELSFFQFVEKCVQG